MQTTDAQPRDSLRALDAGKILATAQALDARVAQRFSNSGLSRVSAELVLIASEARERAVWLTRPNLWVRTAPHGSDAFHWHIDFTPRLTARGAFELGTEVDINIQPPEVAAAELREALE